MEYDFDKHGAGKVIGVTVKKLREQLADLPDDALVVIAKDPEGNGYSPLASIGYDDEGDGVLYEAYNTYSGEITYHEDRVDGEFGPDDPDADHVARCIVLSPIN